MRCFRAALLCLVLLFSAIASPVPELSYYFSFEQDFEGWSSNGFVQTSFGTTIPWSITRSQDRAKDGDWAVRLFLDNISDSGVIWIQRLFTLQPNQIYQVQVSYSLAPIDGPVGSSIILTGALSHPPATRDDLGPFLEDRTNLGRSVGANKWAGHDYEFTAEADGDGSLYVFIGVAADFEIGYVYYLDAVRTKFTMRQPGAAEPLIGSVDFNGVKKVRIRARHLAHHHGSSSTTLIAAISSRFRRTAL